MFEEFVKERMRQESFMSEGIKVEVEGLIKDTREKVKLDNLEQKARILKEVGQGIGAANLSGTAVAEKYHNTVHALLDELNPPKEEKVPQGEQEPVTTP